MRICVFVQLPWLRAMLALWVCSWWVRRKPTRRPVPWTWWSWLNKFKRSAHLFLLWSILLLSCCDLFIQKSISLSFMRVVPNPFNERQKPGKAGNNDIGLTEFYLEGTCTAFCSLFFFCHLLAPTSLVHYKGSTWVLIANTNWW